MGRRDVGRLVIEDREEAEGELDDDQDSPCGGERPCWIAGKESAGPREDRCDQTCGQQRIEPVEHVDPYLKRRDRLKPIPAGGIPGQRIGIGCGPPLPVGQREIRNRQAGMLMAHQESQEELAKDGKKRDLGHRFRNRSVSSAPAVRIPTWRQPEADSRDQGEEKLAEAPVDHSEEDAAGGSCDGPLIQHDPEATQSALNLDRPESHP